MKRTVDPNSNDALLDRLLDQHLADRSEQLAPSSGFVASVMESIQAEAAAPPPIAFPWRRVLPGALAAVCGLIVLVVLVLRGGGTSAVSGPAAPIPVHLAPVSPSQLHHRRNDAWLDSAGRLSLDRSHRRIPPSHRARPVELAAKKRTLQALVIAGPDAPNRTR